MTAVLPERGPDRAAFIAEGASAEVYRIGDGLVLKLFHEGIEGGIIEREFAAARTIQATGLPVARAVERRAVGGRQGIVYTEIGGRDLLRHIRSRPDQALWAMREMVRLQHAIHQQQVPLMRSRKAILAEEIELGPVGGALRDAALARLDQLVEGDRLSHGDLHPANLIVTRDGLAVIDWSRAARAAPAADVVRTEMLLRFGPGQSDSRIKGWGRDMAGRHYLRTYQQLSGMEDEALAAWRPLVALAWLKHRAPGRDAAFERYLDDALAQAGLPARGG